MSERKKQILQAALEIIVEYGYGALTMRALARASGLKLGALQYHYKTRDDMLRAFVGYIAEEYAKTFESTASNIQSASVHEIIDFIIEDPVDQALQTGKLWPQLWAMGQVEPLVADLVDDIYARYLGMLEERLKVVGAESPRAEALCLMSLLEGSTLFLGEGKRWRCEADAVRKSLIAFIDAKYGKDS